MSRNGISFAMSALVIASWGAAFCASCGSTVHESTDNGGTNAQVNGAATVINSGDSNSAKSAVPRYDPVHSNIARRGQLLSWSSPTAEAKHKAAPPKKLDYNIIFREGATSAQVCELALRNMKATQWDQAVPLFTVAMQRLQNEAQMQNAWDIQGVNMNFNQFQNYLYKCRACGFLELGQYESCIADLTDALKLIPDDPDVLIMRGNAYRLWGNGELANEDLRRAQELQAH